MKSIDLVEEIIKDKDNLAENNIHLKNIHSSIKNIKKRMKMACTPSSSLTICLVSESGFQIKVTLSPKAGVSKVSP